MKSLCLGGCRADKFNQRVAAENGSVQRQDCVKRNTPESEFLGQNCSQIHCCLLCILYTVPRNHLQRLLERWLYGASEHLKPSLQDSYKREWASRRVARPACSAARWAGGRSEERGGGTEG